MRRKKEYAKYEDYLTIIKNTNNPSIELFKMKKKIHDMETMLKEQNQLLNNLCSK